MGGQKPRPGDCPGRRVEKHVYLVGSVSEDDVLRGYEGDDYEVVTARIVVHGKDMLRRTFRYAGYEDELSE